jgi:shikimate dehydrogenase
MGGARLGVLGWPVAHSRSPQIQNAALQERGLGDWRYQLLPVPPELFAETVRALPQAGFRGANVTIPHKEAALALADRATDRAQAIGAANTLLFERAIEADNTDAPALMQALPFPAQGTSALVLGAGGSARAAAWALLDGGAEDVRIWNRTPERARVLAGQLGGTSVDHSEPADLLVNCTSSGVEGLPIDEEQLGEYRCVVDFVYGERPTRLVEAARKQGVATVDGLELLILQGALAFELLTGLAAPVEVMRRAARGYRPPQ